MSTSASLPLPAALAPALRTARATVRACLPGRRVEVDAKGLAGPRVATLAAFGYDDPRAGDEVLVFFDGGEAYVVGVLCALRQAPPAPSPSAPDGLRFARDEREPGAALLVVPEGDLRVRVDAGRLELSARDGVTIRGDGEVTVRSGARVDLSCGAARDGAGEGGAAAALVVSPDRIGASAPELLLAAGRARIAATDLDLAAETLALTARTLRLVGRVVETRAHRLVERTRDSYRVVERLAELSADRVRTVARDSARLVGGRVTIEGEKKVRIQGEKIYLA